MKTIPPKEQPKGVLYQMELMFSVDIGLKTIDKLVQDCGFTEMPTITNAKIHIMYQTVPFIPDEDTLNMYAQVIKENYKTNNDITCRNVTFIGYRKLLMVSLDQDESENQASQFYRKEEDNV